MQQPLSDSRLRSLVAPFMVYSTQPEGGIQSATVHLKAQYRPSPFRGNSATQGARPTVPGTPYVHAYIRLGEYVGSLDDLHGKVS